MKWIIALLLLLWLQELSFGQAAGQSPADQTPTGQTLSIGKTGELYSKTLGEKRRILIYLPDSYHDTYFYKRHYPVVYLLDGDSHFYLVSSMIKQMSEDGGGLLFPEMIVVAVLNTDRNRDLTPSRDTSEFRMGRGADNHSGGGERFLSFIGSELIPHIDSLYRTTPYRVFIGHSLGGLTVMNAFVNHPRLFNGYIASDPSMWWDRGRLLQQMQAGKATRDSQGLAKSDLQGPARYGNQCTSLFLAGANSLTNGLDTASVMRDTSSVFSRHMTAIFLTRNTLKAAPLHFGFKYYPEYNHGSVPPVALYDGLRFLFDFYRLDFPHETFEDPAFKGDTLLVAHYAAISRRMGYVVPPPEIFVNNIAYALMGHRQFDRAYYYFRLNQENYPGSFNVYDSIGDWYMARGEKEKAMMSFAKSLSLRENKETRDKLNRLQKTN